MIQKIFSSIEILRSWYERALDLGEQSLISPMESIEKIADERNRILNRIIELQGELKQTFTTPQYLNLPATIRAQVDEKRLQIHDLEPVFQDQMRRIYRTFHPKLVNKRASLVDYNKRNRAIGAYVRSPGFAYH